MNAIHPSRQAFVEDAEQEVSATRPLPPPLPFRRLFDPPLFQDPC
jgi:hypothetical protein